MKSLVFCFILLSVGCTRPQNTQQFERLSAQHLKTHLGSEDFDWYQKSFKAEKHLFRVDTTILLGQVQHLFTNQMADMPGVIQLYKVNLDGAMCYLMVSELAAPLGGHLGIYLLNEYWKPMDELPLSVPYDAPDYGFYQNPDGGLLLAIRSAFTKSIYPHKGLSIIEVNKDSLSLCFRAYTSFTDVVDTRADGCEAEYEAQLIVTDRTLDSISVKTKSWCGLNDQYEKKLQGVYIWNPKKHQYDLTLNASVFDTLLKRHKTEIDILFDLDSRAIRADAVTKLDSLAAFLIKHPTIRIEVRVHCDTRWEDIYGRRWDSIRASAICDYLNAVGVDSTQLSSKGMGDYDPIISEEEIAKMETKVEREIAHQNNRRIEVRVLSR